MKKLKDLFYDINDIIIAVLILLVAAAIILWRMNVILHYPEKALDKTHSNPAISQQEQTQTTDPEIEGGENQEGTSGESSENQEKTEEQAQEDDKSVYDASGCLKKTVKVDLVGNYASQVVQCLVDAGLFESYADYEDVCDSAGIDDEKVLGGEMTFTKGMSKVEIAKKINWGK